MVNNTPKIKHKGLEPLRNTLLINQHLSLYLISAKIELPLLIPGNPQIYLSFIRSHSRALICLDALITAGKKTQGSGKAELS